MSSSKSARIWQRTVVGFSLAGGLALLLFIAARPWGATFTALLGGLIAALGVLEARRMGTLPDGRAAAGALAAVACAALWVVGAEGSTRLRLEHLDAGQRYWVTLLATLGITALVGVVAALPAENRRGKRVLVTLWLAAPLPLLGLMRGALDVQGLAALMVLAKVGDVAGYYGGQALGGQFPTHPFPKLSPGKTTVGCLCSLLTATAVGGLLVAVDWLPAGDLGVLSGMLAGAFINLAAQAGDLAESGAKRAARVKDSGTWFGPSGGVLDLVDSLLIAVPVAALTWPFVLDMPG